jgi:AraC family transcriptional regulator
MVVSTSSVSSGRIDAPHNGEHQAAIDLWNMEEIRPPGDVKSCQPSCSFLHPTVEIAPVEFIKRLGIGRPGWFVESIHAPIGRRMEFRFQGHVHLLTMYNE